MIFQIIYRAHIDFEATYEKLKQTGYSPQKESVGRKPQIESGNLTFKLRSGAKVNISPKGKYHAIQVAWNNIEEMRKHEKQLLDALLVFPTSYDKEMASVDFVPRMMTVSIQVPYNEKLLSRINSAYSEYAKEKEKTRLLAESLFED